MASVDIYYEILQIILSDLDHAFDGQHKDTCQEKCIKLPFRIPLKLLSKREIDVQKGVALIPCCKWKKLLEDVFKFFLNAEVVKIKNSKVIRMLLDVVEEDRIRRIVRKCVDIMTVKACTDYHLTDRCVIDEESRFFPPCMANLHQILRQSHRLLFESR